MAKRAADIKNKVIVFVKAPVPGHVKTRLCPPLSAEQAVTVYRSFVQDTIEVVSAAPFSCQVAYAPSVEFPTPAWTGFDLPWFPQSGNDLGGKLTHAFQSMFDLGASRVLALGTDSPGFNIDQITHAFDQLSSVDAVMGPALDGGYYLIGLSKHFPEIFKGIEWSTSKVADQTRQRVEQQKLTLKEIEAYGDVDTYVDLKNLYELFVNNRINPAWHRTGSTLRRLFEGKNGC